MKKKIALGASALSLLVASVALAVTNTYGVTASTSPTKAGTVAKPQNIKLSFNYSVGEQDNMRPSSVKEYQIKFSGVQVSQKGLGVCTADQINAATTADNCPASAIVGKGSVSNVLGPTNDPSNKSLTCFLNLTIFNGKAGHATLFLQGTASQSVPAEERCITDLAVAIDAKYTSGKGANAFSTLSFEVPQTLRHPISGLDNSVVNVQSTINNVKTKAKKNGKALSYYHSVGGCKNGKRAVQVTFVSEEDQKSVAKTTAKCTK
jgi:hypothetical protein